MPAQVKVMLVDDDDFTRVTLAATVRSLGYSVVADAADVTSAMKAAQAVTPDVAVIDLDFGAGPNGIDLGYGLRRLLPTVGLVMLSSYENPRLLGSGLRPLPDETVYVVKQRVGDPDVLGRALRLAHEPATHTSATLAPSPPSARDELTDSQVELMRLIASGLGNREISVRLSLTEDGVNKAVTRLIRQLALTDEPGRNPRVLITHEYAERIGKSLPSRE